MSSASAAISPSAADARLALAGPEEPPPRSFGAQVWHYTFARAGAKIGAAWIGVIAFLAVFAPFLANGHPWLTRMDGRWRMPAVEHMVPADVVLLAAAVSGVVLWMIKRVPAPTHFLIWLWIVAASIP